MPGSIPQSTLYADQTALPRQCLLPARAGPVLCEWHQQVLLPAGARMLQSGDKLLLPAGANMLPPGDKILLPAGANMLLQSRERLLLPAGTIMLRSADKPLRRCSDGSFELRRLWKCLWPGPNLRQRPMHLPCCRRPF